MPDRKWPEIPSLTMILTPRAELRTQRAPIARLTMTLTRARQGALALSLKRARDLEKLSCLVSWERVRAPLRGISDWNRASRFPSAQAHASVQLSGVMFSSLA